MLSVVNAPHLSKYCFRLIKKGTNIILSGQSPAYKFMFSRWVIQFIRIVIFVSVCFCFGKKVKVSISASKETQYQHYYD